MMHLYVGENTREAHRVRECLADVGIASRLILDLEDGVIEQPALLDISFIEKISASNLAHKNVAVFAGPDQAKLAIQCIQQGAQRYFVRGGELAEIVEWAIENTQLADGSREQTDAAKKPNPSIRNFVCASAAMQKVQQLAEKSAQTDIAILITGASGSGKEVIARHIHDSSPRVAGPYVALNCAAIPESMLEAILFGHVKGAFTGASEQRVGKFQQANGGTLLLDEVTEMPLHLQAKLLRALQEKEVEQIGGNQPQRVDVKVIATTNRDPLQAVQQGILREDLYYRLSVFPIKLPNLSERRDDIEPLVEHFLNKHSQHTRPTISPQALSRISTYQWPGNVRELENCIQRAIVLCDQGEIEIRHLLLEPQVIQHIPQGITVEPSISGSDKSLATKVRSAEEQALLDALSANNGARKKTAVELGISERTLRYKIRQLKDRGLSI